MPKKFLDIEKKFSSYNSSKFIILPCPYEVTTTYKKGTKLGPNAILNASQYIETFDEETGKEICEEVGISTLNPIVSPNNLKKKIEKILGDKKVPIIIGGEHSISAKIIDSFKNFYPDLSVLQFDAHADLRDKYQGSKFNHACAARRILEICPCVQVGVRNISKEGMKFAQKTGQINKIHFAQKIEVVEKIITQLSDTVYINFDIDAFDPSIMPSTGTPEPGGFFWYEVLDILKEVCKLKRVIGFDLVELCPIKGLHAPDFLAAKLIYKIISYLS